ncbi:hypothetical protein GQ42DRAFT_70473 [Ramicandelaber brevisporus]|nr:hypothetical protein GQ42DRAFT_70473 [Ramicandelaber brevisporus]
MSWFQRLRGKGTDRDAAARSQQASPVPPVKPPKPIRFVELPDRFLRRLIGYAPVPDAVNLGCTCHTLARYLSDSSVWRGRLRRCGIEVIGDDASSANSWRPRVLKCPSTLAILFDEVMGIMHSSALIDAIETRPRALYISMYGYLAPFYLDFGSNDGALRKYQVFANSGTLERCAELLDQLTYFAASNPALAKRASKINLKLAAACSVFEATHFSAFVEAYNACDLNGMRREASVLARLRNNDSCIAYTIQRHPLFAGDLWDVNITATQQQNEDNINSNGNGNSNDGGGGCGNGDDVNAVYETMFTDVYTMAGRCSDLAEFGSLLRQLETIISHHAVMCMEVFPSQMTKRSYTPSASIDLGSASPISPVTTTASISDKPSDNQIDYDDAHIASNPLLAFINRLYMTLVSDTIQRLLSREHHQQKNDQSDRGLLHYLDATVGMYCLCRDSMDRLVDEHLLNIDKSSGYRIVNSLFANFLTSYLEQEFTLLSGRFDKELETWTSASKQPQIQQLPEQIATDNTATVETDAANASSPITAQQQQQQPEPWKHTFRDVVGYRREVLDVLESYWRSTESTTEGSLSRRHATNNPAEHAIQATDSLRGAAARFGPDGSPIPNGFSSSSPISLELMFAMLYDLSISFSRAMFFTEPPADYFTRSTLQIGTERMYMLLSRTIGVRHVRPAFRSLTSVISSAHAAQLTKKAALRAAPPPPTAPTSTSSATSSMRKTPGMVSANQSTESLGSRSVPTSPLATEAPSFKGTVQTGSGLAVAGLTAALSPTVSSTSLNIAPTCDDKILHAMNKLFDLVSLSSIVVGILDQAYYVGLARFLPAHLLQQQIKITSDMRAIKEKDAFEKMVQTETRRCNDKLIDAIIDHLDYILIKEQNPSDYNPPPTEAPDLIPSKACSDTVSVLAEYCDLITTRLEPFAADVLLGELGMNVHGLLCRNILRWDISTTGGLSLICDLNKYHSWATDTFADSSTEISSKVMKAFGLLKDCGNLFIVSPPDLKVLLHGSDKEDEMLIPEGVQATTRRGRAATATDDALSSPPLPLPSPSNSKRSSASTASQSPPPSSATSTVRRKRYDDDTLGGVMTYEQIRAFVSRRTDWRQIRRMVDETCSLM